MSALSFLFWYFFSYHPGACMLVLTGISIQHTEQYPRCSAYFWLGEALGFARKWCSILILVPWHCLDNKVYPHTLSFIFFNSRSRDENLDIITPKVIPRIAKVNWGISNSKPSTHWISTKNPAIRIPIPKPNQIPICSTKYLTIPYTNGANTPRKQK